MTGMKVMAIRPAVLVTSSAVDAYQRVEPTWSLVVISNRTFRTLAMPAMRKGRPSLRGVEWNMAVAIAGPGRARIS